MPIYEYACKKCGHMLEVLQKMDAAGPEQDCPVCGGVEFEKMISRPNVGKASIGSDREPLCCGRSERMPSCTPGGCCGCEQ